MTPIAKPKTDRERAAAEFVLKGALTRIALMFQMSGRSFTGSEVAEILITLQIGHERNAELEQAALPCEEERPLVDDEVQP